METVRRVAVDSAAMIRTSESDLAALIRKR